MKQEDESTHLSRRDALRQTLLASLGMSIPNLAAAAEPESLKETEFIPENDYPFFGYNPMTES